MIGRLRKWANRKRLESVTCQEAAQIMNASKSKKWKDHKRETAIALAHQIGRPDLADRLRGNRK